MNISLISEVSDTIENTFTKFSENASILLLGIGLLFLIIIIYKEIINKYPASKKLYIGLFIFIFTGVAGGIVSDLAKTPVTIRTYSIIENNEEIGKVTATYNKDEKLIACDTTLFDEDKDSEYITNAFKKVDESR